ncbi:hypothetical protein [Spirillospora sp. NPDC029432]|uniref:hypothetical protein n=1 Tax=Spirillospora sp. NPDC029432 TaxID=3154599 RepID=UPI00345568F5
MSSPALPVRDIHPQELRRQRVRTQVRMDLWDAGACGLEDTSAATRLSMLRMGVGEAADRPDAGVSVPRQAPRAATYLVHPPSYVPYESAQVPRAPAGEEMCRQAIGAVFCDDVAASVASGPLAAAALLTAVSTRAGLAGDAGIGSVLAALAACVPRKGGEVEEFLSQYCLRNATSPPPAVPMVMRDFFTSFLAWQFIRCTDGGLLNLAGSVLCLTTAIDYVGAPDDAGGGGHDAYVRAAGEGVACLSGPAATRALHDIVLVDAFMRVKDAMKAVADELADPRRFTADCGGPVTPLEYMQARWWDGAMAPHHRLPMGTVAYRHLTDEFGAFTAAAQCGTIQRALDNLIRYNEIVDMVPDHAQGESFNEVNVALAVGGGDAVRGYAEALARVIDDALECRCGTAGHQEVAELAMGGCLMYLLAPRWNARRQLRGLTAAGSAAAQAFAWPAPGRRLQAVASTALPPGDTLYTPLWDPLWKQDPPLAGPHAAPELARRAVSRSLPGAAIDPQDLRPCHAAFEAALTACDTCGDDSGLPALAELWCAAFDTVLAASAAGRTIPEHATTALRSALARIWKQAIIGESDERTPHPDQCLFIDTDHAVRRTYSLPPYQGLALRRAFFGVATSAAELSGLNPYARFTGGVSLLIAESRRNEASRRDRGDEDGLPPR